MKAGELEELIRSGYQLIENIQEAFHKSLTIKYSYWDIFCRKKINTEEEELSKLISQYTHYVKNNSEMQPELTKGSLNDRQYNQPSLIVIQSQKETVMFLTKSLVDSISSHRDQLNSYSGQFIAFTALIVAIVSLVLSLTV